MLHILLPSLSGILFVVGDSLVRFLPKSVSTLDYVLLRSMYLGIICFCVSMFLIYILKKDTMSIFKLEPFTHTFNIILLCSMIQFVGISLIIYSTRVYKIGLTIALLNIFSIITGVITGYLINKEHLNLQKIIGILFLLIGIVLFK